MVGCRNHLPDGQKKAISQVARYRKVYKKRSKRNITHAMNPRIFAFAT
jgi:hypothetical protein